MPAEKKFPIKDAELYEKLRDDGAFTEKAAAHRMRQPRRDAPQSKEGPRERLLRRLERAELKKKAKELGPSGYSKKNKSDLIHSLRNH